VSSSAIRSVLGSLLESMSQQAGSVSSSAIGSILESMPGSVLESVLKVYMGA